MTDSAAADQSQKYNERELRPPEWLNEQLFAQVLSKKHGGAEVQVSQCALTPGTTANEHYATVMFRARVHYICTGAEHFQSMIIKTMPVADDDGTEFYVGETTIFETEIKMYTETLPRMTAILEQYGDETKLCAGMLHHSLTPHKCIILDDLIELGYITIAGRWLNVDEVKQALLKLAKLHAVSYKLAQECPDDPLTQYASSPFANMNLYEDVMYREGVRNFIALLERHADLAVYVPHFQRLGDRLLSNCIGFFDRQKEIANGGGIKVLNHGDYHMKNMMLRLNKELNTVDDLMLIDFQFCYYGSLGIDLCYAIVMLFSPEMRRSHRDELIAYYTEHFQQTLRLIEYRAHIPTAAEIKSELGRLKHCELFMFIVFLVFNHVFADAAGDVGRTVQDESYRQQLVEHPEFLNELRLLLPQFLAQGYFDD